MTNLSSVAVVIIGSSVAAASFDRSRFALLENDWLSMDTLHSWDDAFDDMEQHANINSGCRELDGLACIPAELLAGPSGWALVAQP
jgi:hypothetical protein